jgi:hypothetical protein
VKGFKLIVQFVRFFLGQGLGLVRRCRISLMLTQFGLSNLIQDVAHPERSRFSGVAKDLSLNRPNAQAWLQTGFAL